MEDARDEEALRRDVDDRPAAPLRRPWQTPEVLRSDSRLTMHGNCGGVDGVFSSS